MHSTRHEALSSLVRALYVAGAVNREVQRRAVPEHAPAGLQALAVLARTDATRVSEVANRLRIDLSVASRQVAALETAGWVAREADPDDRRAQRVRVTRAGQTVLEDTRTRMADAYSQVLGSWSEQDVLALTTALERLREDFVRASAPALAEASR
jgi:DNA-binding MarR family transcriptional regulator